MIVNGGALTLVRNAAASAFIPWEWVKIPEETARQVVNSLPGGVGTFFSAAVDLFVHGDGRGPGEKPGGSYRLT